MPGQCAATASRSTRRLTQGCRSWFTRERIRRLANEQGTVADASNRPGGILATARAVDGTLSGGTDSERQDGALHMVP